MGRDPKVFVSFSTEQRVLARRLYNDLTAGGAKVFQVEESALPGTEAWSQVLEAIAGADWFVVLLTEAAMESAPVRTEIAHAYYCNVNAGHPILIPAVVEPVAQPEELRTLADLPFDDYRAGLQTLTQLLRRDGQITRPNPTSHRPRGWLDWLPTRNPRGQGRSLLSMLRGSVLSVSLLTVTTTTFLNVYTTPLDSSGIIVVFMGWGMIVVLAKKAWMAGRGG